MNDADYLVSEIRMLCTKFHEPHPPLKTDDALALGFEIRRRFEELDRILQAGGEFPRSWITKENQW